MHDPIGYTYEADVHCPSCAIARFGEDDNGYPPESAVDGEGNPLGTIAPWDEWQNIGEGNQTLACGTCGVEIDTYEEATTPDESDAYISDARDGYSVSFDGRYVGTYARQTRAAAAVYLAMLRSGFFPNVWTVNDHGNHTLCVFEGHRLVFTDTAYV